ncbi:hypothetical protein [Intestinimonas butyriciproducens]|uniref:hypothetical protein n=1 Tax=Intestinimonas butyriciproducens TaxID=1297617 RepID=UPI00195AB86A|nr:hypothetical protein [Intestinimonas butyriciproducens]MBM6919496.1 hypothetical protein [Intestinimonas butyriciproducens]
MAFIIVMVSLVLAGVISTAWLRVFDQPKKKENGIYPPWVVLYYLVAVLALILPLSVFLITCTETNTNMGILSNPMLYLYSLPDRWTMTGYGGGMFALLASCGLAVLLLTLVLCAVKLIVMRLKKQQAASSIWLSFFISLGLLLFLLGYASFLELSFVLLPVLLLCVILRLIWRRMKKLPMPSFLWVTLVAFVLLGAGFVTTADQYNTVVRKENYITDITYKYNKDGTIRHDEDGNKELKTSWGRRTVQGYGMNPTPLFFALGCYVCLIYNLRGTGKIAAEAQAQKEAAEAKTKAGTKTAARTTAKAGTKTAAKTRAKAPAKSKLPSAGEQEKARRAAMKKAQAEKKDENDPT